MASVPPLYSVLSPCIRLKNSTSVAPVDRNENHYMQWYIHTRIKRCICNAWTVVQIIMRIFCDYIVLFIILLTRWCSMNPCCAAVYGEVVDHGELVG